MYYAINYTTKNELLTWKDKIIVGTLQGMTWLKGGRKDFKIIEYNRLSNNLELKNTIGFCEWWMTGGVTTFTVVKKVRCPFAKDNNA